MAKTNKHSMAKVQPKGLSKQLPYAACNFSTSDDWRNLNWIINLGAQKIQEILNQHQQQIVQAMMQKDSATAAKHVAAINDVMMAADCVNRLLQSWIDHCPLLANSTVPEVAEQDVSTMQAPKAADAKKRLRAEIREENKRIAAELEKMD